MTERSISPFRLRAPRLTSDCFLKAPGVHLVMLRSSSKRDNECERLQVFAFPRSNRFLLFPENFYCVKLFGNLVCNAAENAGALLRLKAR